MVRGWATGGLFAALMASACSFHAHGVDTDGGAAVTVVPDLATVAADLDAPPTTTIDLAMAPTTPPDLATPPMPTLTVTRTNPPMGSGVNLTNEGTYDWAHFGRNSVADINRLAGGPVAVVVTVNGSEQQYSSYLDRFSWTNGTPTPTETGTNSGVYVRTQGSSFTLTLPAGVAPRTARLYLSQYKSTSTFTAHLSDGSKPDFTEMQTVGNAELYSKYTIVYAAASDGQQLVVTWLLSADGGNGSVDLHAVTLQ